MRILHTADWHIGAKTDDLDRFEEQKQVLDEIISVVNYENILNLKNVTEKLHFGSLKKRFDKIWAKSNIRNTTVPKKTAYKTLQKAFALTDEDDAGDRINELNFDLKEKYFNKKFGI